MRLLLAADIFPPESGGPATYVVALAQAFSKEDVKIVSLNPDSDTTKVECPLFVVQSKSKLRRYAEYFSLLWKQSKDVDVIYAMGPVNAGLPALIVSKLRGKKFFVKVVGDYAWEQGKQRFGVKELVDEFQRKKYGFHVEGLRAIEKFVTRQASRVIVPSLYLKKMVKGWGVPERKIETVYNAVPFHEAVPLQKPSGEKWVVSVARLMSWKGLDTLIEIVGEISKDIPGLKLKIVGDGPERKNLELLIQNKGLEQVVELSGNVSQEKALSYTAAADVFVLNSAYEGLSHALLEAVHCNVPILASQIGGNPEVVVGWSRGDLFGYNNKGELKEKILLVLRGQISLHPWKEEDKKEFYEMFAHETMIERTKMILALPKVLMISLDAHFFDVESNVVNRIISNQMSGEIFVLIPGNEDVYSRPHPRVYLFGRGGSKIRQFFSLWKLGRKLNAQENFSFITAQDPFFTGLLGWFVKKKRQEFIVQMHGDFYSNEYYKKNSLKNRVQYYLGLFILKRATQIRVVGQRIEQSLLQRGFSQKQFYIQPVKIDIEHIQKTPPAFDIHRKYIGSERVFVFLGRLESVKNISWLITVFSEVAKHHPNDRLLIVGDGVLRDKLQEQVKKMHLESSVIFEAWTSDPLSFLKTADALLFPSLSEGYGMVVIEAQAAGCPIIMNDVGVAGYEVKESPLVKIIPVSKKEEWVQAIASTPKRFPNEVK